EHARPAAGCTRDHGGSPVVQRAVRLAQRSPGAAPTRGGQGLDRQLPRASASGGFRDGGGLDKGDFRVLYFAARGGRCPTRQSIRIRAMSWWVARRSFV